MPGAGPVEVLTEPVKGNFRWNEERPEVPTGSYEEPFLTTAQIVRTPPLDGKKSNHLRWGAGYWWELEAITYGRSSLTYTDGMTVSVSWQFTDCADGLQAFSEVITGRDPTPLWWVSRFDGTKYRRSEADPDVVLVMRHGEDYLPPEHCL